MMRIHYYTIKGNDYPLDLYIQEITVRQLSFEPELVNALCKTGCSNYGKTGGCPPRAPRLDQLYNVEQRAVLFACKFESIYKPIRVKSSNNMAIHWKFQDVVLANCLNKMGDDLRRRIGGSYLATGYCKGCQGKKCSFKIGMEFCRNPQKRTYSLEAVGINVVRTVKQNFDMDMYWYKKGNLDVPYMLKVMAFFPSTNEIDVNHDILNHLKALSYLSME